MFKAYAKEWETGRKGRWVWDENRKPLMLDGVDITYEEREAILRETDSLNSKAPDYTSSENQEQIFEEVNKMADQLVKDPAVLESGIHIVILIARPDSFKGQGKIHSQSI
jgi:hypothetical protein